MTELEKARQIINDVDVKMAELFEKRMDAARIVAEYLNALGMLEKGHFVKLMILRVKSNSLREIAL
mgnify:CR=1 FL=1